MKLYEFYQNNSGGHYQKNAPLKLYIQAPTAEVANIIAEEHGVYFDGVESEIDCSCCGDRWSRVNEYFDSKEEVDISKDENIKIIYTTGVFKELV